MQLRIRTSTVNLAMTRHNQAMVVIARAGDATDTGSTARLTGF